MNIMFEESITDEVREKYTLLELDTFHFANTDTTSTAYCLIENIPIQEMLTIEQFQSLHSNLIKNYRSKNWKFCEDAVEHLTGKWNSEVDSFYVNLMDRVNQYKSQDPGTDWTGIIPRP